MEAWITPQLVELILQLGLGGLAIWLLFRLLSRMINVLPELQKEVVEMRKSVCRLNDKLSVYLDLTVSNQTSNPPPTSPGKNIPTGFFKANGSEQENVQEK